MRGTQVAGFLGVILCALVPAVAYPAFKAATADPDTEMKGAEAGFNKSGGMWTNIDK